MVCWYIAVQKLKRVIDEQPKSVSLGHGFKTSLGYYHHWKITGHACWRFNLDEGACPNQLSHWMSAIWWFQKNKSARNGVTLNFLRVMETVFLVNQRFFMLGVHGQASQAALLLEHKQSETWEGQLRRKKWNLNNTDNVPGNESPWGHELKAHHVMMRRKTKLTHATEVLLGICALVCMKISWWLHKCRCHCINHTQGACALCALSRCWLCYKRHD